MTYRDTILSLICMEDQPPKLSSLKNVTWYPIQVNIKVPLFDRIVRLLNIWKHERAVLLWNASDKFLGIAWCRHQMETFSALLALCAGNSPGPVNSPHKGQWRGALMFSLICVWINGWVNNREAGDLRRYRGHYDVNVMEYNNYAHASRSLLFSHLLLCKSMYSWFLLWYGGNHMLIITFQCQGSSSDVGSDGAELVPSHYLNQWWKANIFKSITRFH